MKHRTLQLSLFFATLALCVGAAFWPSQRTSLVKASPAKTFPQGPITAIVGARIHTMHTNAPFVGTVLIQGQHVLAVGRKVKVPANARVINGKHKVVTPGIALADTTVGLVEVGAVRNSHNASMKARSAIRAAFDVLDGINHNSVTIPVARIEGITTVMVRPRGGLVAGRSALLDLLGTSRQMVVRAPLGVHAAIPGGNAATAWLKLRQLLDDTRFYAQYTRRYQRGQARRLSTSHLHLRAMLPVIRRQIPLVLQVNRAADILRAIRFSRRQRIRVVLLGATEAWQVAKQLAAAKIPVILGFPRNLPYSFDRLGNRYDHAALLHRAGVLFAFGAHGGSHHIRNVRQEAGIAVAWGLPHQAALRAITANLYKIFGLSARAGTLQAGKAANVVLWNGDPLELSTFAQQVWIRGQAIPMQSRQTLLRDRYRHARFLR